MYDIYEYTASLKASEERKFHERDPSPVDEDCDDGLDYADEQERD